MQHHHGHTHGVHGMLVLGGQRTDTALRSPVYVSHLPMFSAPHDFQVIVRVGGDAAKTYGDFVAHFGLDPIFTFQPEPFSIDELDPHAPGGPARTSFGGNLFRGHFERGGSDIAADTLFEVEQVIHFRRFRSGGDPDKGQLRYLFFGQPDAAHLAHLVEGPPPDFDQVLQVEAGGLSGVSPEQLRTGEVTRSTRGCSRARLSLPSSRASRPVDPRRSSSWSHPSTTSRPEISPRSEAARANFAAGTLVCSMTGERSQS
jgi:hypothetical protein